MKAGSDICCMNIELIRKYNVPAPRYTSYPTVPYWDSKAPSEQQWKESVINSFQIANRTDGISLYIHLPYCESLCTYCGCNTRITVNHKVERPYIDAVLKEWEMYLSIFPDKPNICEIHLGGGTPTFFSAENLSHLLSNIIANGKLCKDAQLSFEAHPANTTREHLEQLYTIGFRRLSLGIQDFDPHVQDVINRKQSEEQVRDITELARKIGYTSVNYDLIYGLPFQTKESVEATVKKVIDLHPDRIAFYAYAHVPWIKPGQRKYSEADLPQMETKLELYDLGRKFLEGAGYTEIGMDHFALQGDELLIAEQQDRLHRNFMGYTTTQSKLLIGLGTSSISDSWFGFVQNIKTVEEYQEAVQQGRFPFFKGHILSHEDLILRKHILNIMCTYKTSWKEEDQQCQSLYEGLERMNEAVADGLVILEPFQLHITEKGKSFLRNVCMALDARLHRNQPTQKIFSSAI